MNAVTSLPSARSGETDLLADLGEALLAVLLQRVEDREVGGVEVGRGGSVEFH
jgi:hypothetical protein